MIENSDIPTLIAESVDGYDDQWRVYCEFCKAWHYHGAIEGHRWAHCTKDSSPYLKTGYIIVATETTRKASPLPMKAV